MKEGPLYVNELFVQLRDTYNTRSHIALDIHFKKSNLGQRSISVIRPSIWKKLRNKLKVSKFTTLFTHNYKKPVLQNLSAKNSFLIIIFNHYRYCYLKHFTIVVTIAFIFIIIVIVNVAIFLFIIIFIIDITTTITTLTFQTIIFTI